MLMILFDVFLEDCYKFIYWLDMVEWFNDFEYFENVEEGF